MSSRRVSGWLALLLGAIAVALSWLAFFRSAEPTVTTKARAASRPDPVARESTPRKEPRRAPIAANIASKEGPRIESIDVDKTEVCYGEENFANVRAFDASGSMDRLMVRMSGTREMGFRLPFRINKNGGMQPRSVVVNGPGGPPAVGEIPEVKVKDCELPEQVTIGVRLVDRSPHFFTLSAELLSSPGAPRFEPVSYEWDFGDGSKETTKSATVQHSYEGKPQKTRFSYFLMSVTVKDRTGRRVVGSRAYGFPNFGFGTFVDDRRILVHTAGGSRPGVRAEEERIRLYHGYEETVRLERVRSIELDSSTKRELASVEGSPQSLLGVSEISPGKSIPTRDLSALRPSEPNRVRKLELVGHAGSVEARGTIVLTSLAKAPEEAPADTDVAKSDPTLGLSAAPQL
jgi:hypothetical protein